MSITPPSIIPVSVDYTGRDYYAIRAELITRIQDRIPEWTASDPADFGVALVEAFAYMGDIISYYIDRNANENYISTAVQRSSVLNIANIYGYTPVSYRQASVTLTYTNTSANDYTVPAGTIVSGDVITGDVSNTVYFTVLADTFVAAQVDTTPGTGTVLATEGRSVIVVDSENSDATYGELIGTSNGLPNQTMPLLETPVVDGSLEIYVQDGDQYIKWTRVTNLLDHSANEIVYTTSVDEYDVVTVIFGDGVGGAIPNKYEAVRAVYTVGGGSVGNVPINTLTNINLIPGLSESQTTALSADVAITNLEAAIGGSDPESTDLIRINAPLALRSGNRAVTLQDYASLSLSVQNVGKANATASTWTSVTVYLAPVRLSTDTDLAPGLDDVGSPTIEFTNLSSSVLSYLLDKVLLGTTVTIQPPTYVDANITIQYSKSPQYTTTEVETALKTKLLTNYGYNGMYFEDTIYPQDIESVLRTVPGVNNVILTQLYRYGGSAALTTLVGSPSEIFRFQETNIGIGSI